MKTTRQEMQPEIEAKFWIESKDLAREKLKAAGAELIRPEFLQRRTVFSLPVANSIQGSWLRVRDEGDKVTLSLKQEENAENIHGMKELQLIVDNYAGACELLTQLGCEEKAYQETKREIWKLSAAEVTIDEWPFLPAFVEIEAGSEEEVKAAAVKLTLDYSQAFFGAADAAYAKQYGVTKDLVNNHTPKLTFDMPNPFTAQ